MSDLALLTAAFVSAVCGMAWLALAMKPHWAQVQSAKPHTATVARRLRIAGAAALLLSLAASLGADHPSMALLVWVMTSSVSAVIVAMALAYWPKCFVWLTWSPDGSGKPELPAPAVPRGQSVYVARFAEPLDATSTHSRAGHH